MGQGGSRRALLHPTLQLRPRPRQRAGAGTSAAVGHGAVSGGSVQLVQETCQYRLKEILVMLLPRLGPEHPASSTGS